MAGISRGFRLLTMVRRCVICFVVCVLAPAVPASTILSFTGDLRTDANFVDCGLGCSLGSGNTDGDYAQWAAVSLSFVVPVSSTMTAITFSYGGGVNGSGASIAEGGFQPYLSLFNGSGAFLASTFFGVTCPAGANINSISGACFDVSLDGGVLAPGTYQIAMSSFINLSLAENFGSGTLADGFSGLGNLFPGEDLHYAFDVVLTSAEAVPEPGSAVLVFCGLLLFCLSVKKSRLAMYWHISGR